MALMILFLQSTENFKNNHMRKSEKGKRMTANNAERQVCDRGRQNIQKGVGGERAEK